MRDRNPAKQPKIRGRHHPRPPEPRPDGRLVALDHAAQVAASSNKTDRVLKTAGSADFMAAGNDQFEPGE